MPVTCKEIMGKFRIVEAATGRISKTSKGHAVDGGGHKTKAACSAQARAINASLHREGKI